MAAKSTSGRQESGVATGGSGTGGAVGGGGTDTSRVSSVSSQFSDAPQASPSSHSSTPSWCEEPAQSNMDISTGHMILVHTKTGSPGFSLLKLFSKYQWHKHTLFSVCLSVGIYGGPCEE